MSIRTNFIYNSILTLSNYIISLILFPYISRVLGVDNIGAVSFVDNTINYFALFTVLGINTIGVREIAACGNDPIKRSKVFSELLSIIVILIFIVSCIYFISIFTIPGLVKYKSLFLIGYSKLLCLSLLVEWLFRGLENFKYITIRNVFVRVLYIISVFIFVKKKDDVNIYYILTCTTVIVNCIINLVYSRHFVKITFQKYNPIKYLKPMFTLGSYSILTSMYTTFNIIYLGFVASETEVGYYSTAIKIYVIIIGFFGTFTSVMMPRMSALISKGDKNSFNQLINKSLNIMYSICIPLSIGGFCLAPQLIFLLSGKGYEGAIIPMQIIMPLIIIVGTAQVLAIQVLVPLRKDKVILKASIIGAIVGVVLNIIFVKYYKAIGTSIVLLISEISVTSYYLITSYRTSILTKPMKFFLKELVYSIPYLIICILSIKFINNPGICCCVSLGLSLLYFSLIHKDIIFVILNKKVNNER